jgi:hypothetical protein
LPRIEEDGGRWLRRPKLYKRVVEPHKKKKKKKKKKMKKKKMMMMMINYCIFIHAFHKDLISFFSRFALHKCRFYTTYIYMCVCVCVYNG